MTTNRNEMPAPFELAKTYVSSSTGRTCNKPQGWEVSCPGVFMWGRTRAGDAWYNSKREAICTMWRRYDQAHTGLPKELANLRAGYIDWLLKVWPEAPAALAAMEIYKAQCEKAHKAQEAEIERKATMNCESADLAKDETFRSVVGALRSKGFSPGEVYVIIGGALEVK